ncbi:AfsR/SARP family transcriptional regulator [Deinococcus sp.]|uniref:AfsR/SARP family transcriptional regulator n=1 Tax=Deinococcus sp. TaxID=47478 RepID=UPI003B5B435E
MPQITDPPPALSIHVLGTPLVRIGEQVAHFRTRKALALLCYLALEGPQTQDALLELFWPDTLGSGSLRTAALHLRQALGPHAWRLKTRWCNLAFEQEGVTLDAATLSTLDAASVLRGQHGEFLAGLYLRGNAVWDDYLSERGEALRAEYDRRLAELTEQALHYGDAAQALALATRRTELDPFSETACLQRVQALQAAGLGHRVQSVWAAFSQRFEREFGPLPSAPVPWFSPFSSALA